MIKTKPLKVVQPPKPEDEIPFEVLATSIRDIAQMGKRINASKLNRRAVKVLMHDFTAVPMVHIETILDALPQLEKKYLRP